MSPPSCFKCGSSYVQRARMRTWWQRLLKKYTPLRRYACGDCYHRGWTTASFERPEPAGAPAGLARPAGATEGDRDGGLPVPAAVVMVLGFLTASVVGSLLP